MIVLKCSIWFTEILGEGKIDIHIFFNLFSYSESRSKRSLDHKPDPVPPEVLWMNTNQSTLSHFSSSSLIEFITLLFIAPFSLSQENPFPNLSLLSQKPKKIIDFHDQRGIQYHYF